MKENCKKKITNELTCTFWLLFSVILIIYIIILSFIYNQSGYSCGLTNINQSATDKFLTQLIAGVTLIIATASIWIFYLTLKTQQNEIKQNHLRFEIQQFESMVIMLRFCTGTWTIFIFEPWKLSQQFLHMFFLSCSSLHTCKKVYSLKFWGK